jgi:hypothetical protein
MEKLDAGPRAVFRRALAVFYACCEQKAASADRGEHVVRRVLLWFSIAGCCGCGVVGACGPALRRVLQSPRPSRLTIVLCRKVIGDRWSLRGTPLRSAAEGHRFGR